MKLLLGCDPEVFVRKPGRKTFHSAYGLNEGTKDNPVRVDKGAVQVDGMALEFNIDPAATEDEWYENISTVLRQVRESVPTFDVIATPVAHFTKKHMDSQPEEAVELGCNPDFNAWAGGAVNPKPDGKVYFRTGAGHIHFGWTQDADIHNPLHLEACILLVQALDLTLGPMCTLFDDGYRRRELYGSAGAFRPKPYGCEYRVLSNAWLKDEQTIRWVFRVCHQVFDRLVAGDFPLKTWRQTRLLSFLGKRHLSADDVWYLRDFCRVVADVEMPKEF